MDDELQYRSAGHINLPQEVKKSTTDERDFSTLKSVRDVFEANMEALTKDFNALVIFEGNDPDVTARDLVVQVKARQLAYQILSPILETLRSTLSNIDQ